MDGSGSMKINNFILMKQFVRDFAAKLAYGPDKSNFGVVTFGKYQNRCRCNASNS